MDNALRHIHRNGRAIKGLRQAARILAGIMESRSLGFLEISNLTGISTQVLDRLIHTHAATMPTLKAIEKTFHVDLPMPDEIRRYTGKIIAQRDGGWVYEVTCGPGNECISWRRGSRADVEAHMQRILNRCNRDGKWWF